MRGRTFKNAYIIADEMQNSSPNQMLMLTTRIGENSKMIVTGDLKQTDKPLKSGLSDFISRFNHYRDQYISQRPNISLSNYTNSFIKEVGIQIIEFTKEDIQRHPVVNQILDIYENYDNQINKMNPNNQNQINDYNENNYNIKYIKYDLIKENQRRREELNNNNSNKNISIENDSALIPKYLYK
jgi:phosphate starvation-inducible protein PhoH